MITKLVSFYRVDQGIKSVYKSFELCIASTSKYIAHIEQ